MKCVVGENGRNPLKNLPRPRFVHHETHNGGTETRTRDPSGWRRVPNRLRHEAAAEIYNNNNNNNNINNNNNNNNNNNLFTLAELRP